MRGVGEWRESVSEDISCPSHVALDFSSQGATFRVRMVPVAFDDFYNRRVQIGFDCANSFRAQELA